jgi:hypothetical protein
MTPCSRLASVPVGGRASIGRGRRQVTALCDGAGELDLTAKLVY